VQPDRYAVELIISGLLGALVQSKAVNVGVLEDRVLSPLLHHMQAHKSYMEKTEVSKERSRHNQISLECMTWHAHLESVLSGLK
jgi:hypothetical protein